jgi:hypothetical protein
MRTAIRLVAIAGLIFGASFAVTGAALAQGNTDAAHSQCAQGGGNGPVFGASGGGGITALTDPNADHGAAGVLANNSNAGGAAEGGNEGGLGGSSLKGGGAAGCGALVGRVLPATGAGTDRLALMGVALALGGAWLLNLSRLHAYSLSLAVPAPGQHRLVASRLRAGRRALTQYLYPTRG